MPPDDKKPPTQEKPTVRDMNAVPPWAIALTEKVTQGFSRVEANLGLLSSDLEVVKGRVGNLEEARRNDEQRANATSLKVRSISEADMSHEAKLADVVIWRAAVEKKLVDIETKTDVQTSILEGLAKFSKDPRVLALVFAVIAYVTQYIARHT